MIFRIGGDECALLTNRDDVAYAEEIAERLRAYNGKPIVYEGKEIPLSLHIAVTKLSSDHLRHRDLYEQLYSAICEVKNE